LAIKSIFNPTKKIENVVLIIVVAEELKPILDRYQPVVDEELNNEFMNLAHAWTAWIGDENDKYKLTVLQVGTSSLYHRHNSGYSQVAAICALSEKIIHPDIVVSFGTAGGTEGKVKIGDVVIGTGCVYVDRIRTSSKNSFDWGIYGGPCMDFSHKIIESLGFIRGVVGSQINYSLNEVQTELINTVNAICLDMEAASIAGILQQMEVNFMAIKTISNFIYPGEPLKMEEEYILHKEVVSAKSSVALSSFFSYLVGKKIGDL